MGVGQAGPGALRAGQTRSWAGDRAVPAGLPCSSDSRHSGLCSGRCALQWPDSCPCQSSAHTRTRPSRHSTTPGKAEQDRSHPLPPGRAADHLAGHSKAPARRTLPSLNMAAPTSPAREAPARVASARLLSRDARPLRKLDGDAQAAFGGWPAERGAGAVPRCRGAWRAPGRPGWQRSPVFSRRTGWVRTAVVWRQRPQFRLEGSACPRGGSRPFAARSRSRFGPSVPRSPWPCVPSAPAPSESVPTPLPAASTAPRPGPRPSGCAPAAVPGSLPGRVGAFGGGTGAPGTLGGRSAEAVSSPVPSDIIGWLAVTNPSEREGSTYTPSISECFQCRHSAVNSWVFQKNGCQSDVFLVTFSSNFCSYLKKKKKLFCVKTFCWSKTNVKECSL